jgi:ABC-type multidrug transport system fused ATPase/permease subunit
MKDKTNKLIRFFRSWERQSAYLKWMSAQTKPFIGSLTLVLVLNLIITASGIGATVVTKYIIDGATGEGAVFSTQGILLLIMLTALGIAIGAGVGILSSYISERYAFGIRTKVYENILHGAWQKIISYHSGDMITRLTSDIERVANGISSIIPHLFLLLFQLVAAFFVLYYYDHFLALTALTIGPVGMLLSLVFSVRLKKYQVKLNRSESEYRSFMQETIENISVTKSFEQEMLYGQKLLSFRDKRLQIIMKRNKLNTAMNVCVRSVFSAGYLVAFCWGVYGLSTGSITYGTMTIFLSLVAQVQGPIVGMGTMVPKFIMVLSSAGRIMEMDATEREAISDLRIRPEEKNIGLRLRGGSFGYGSEEVLQDVHLDINPNEVVGVMGESGSGKTTLIRLILSLIKLKAGNLEFFDDSGNIEEGSACSRRFISYVPQGNTLISGTIAENLRTGKQNATERDMWEVLKIADCESVVAGMEKGLYTRIGENGLGLSEGQAQRIAIARAIIKAAPILILDEATSALDARTEERVIKRMRVSRFLHTCLIITHRRSMIAYCTRAIEIRDGKILELEPRAETEDAGNPALQKGEL